jgi:hypothetical protein
LTTQELWFNQTLDHFSPFVFPLSLVFFWFCCFGWNRNWASCLLLKSSFLYWIFQVWSLLPYFHNLSLLKKMW